MKTVSLNLKVGDKTAVKAIPINDRITLDTPFVDMAQYLDKDSLGLLVHITYKHIVQLHLTKVSPYILLFFDDALQYTGATHSISSGTGTFTMQTAYKHVLFLKLPHDVAGQTILSLKKQ